MKRTKPDIDLPRPDYDPTLIGYARVSTEDQNEELQVHALLRAGVHPDNIHVDHGVSGRAEHKPGREMALKQCREGDTLVIWRLDRLSRDTVDLLLTLRKMKRDGVKFRALTEAIGDEQGPTSTLLLTLASAVAQFESDVARERTIAGIQEAKARGVKFGQPSKITDDVREKIETRLAAGERVTDIAKRLKIAPSTIRKYWSGEKLIAARTSKPKNPKSR